MIVETWRVARRTSERRRGDPRSGGSVILETWREAQRSSERRCGDPRSGGSVILETWREARRSLRFGGAEDAALEMWRHFIAPALSQKRNAPTRAPCAGRFVFHRAPSCARAGCAGAGVFNRTLLGQNLTPFSLLNLAGPGPVKFSITLAPI